MSILIPKKIINGSEEFLMVRMMEWFQLIATVYGLKDYLWNGLGPRRSLQQWTLWSALPWPELPQPCRHVRHDNGDVTLLVMKMSIEMEWWQRPITKAFRVFFFFPWSRTLPRQICKAITFVTLITLGAVHILCQPILGVFRSPPLPPLGVGDVHFS